MYTDRQSKGTNFLVTTAAFVIVVAGMRATESILVPFLLSVFFAIVCAPPLMWLKRKGIPTLLAVLVVVSAVLLAGLIMVALIGTSLNDLSSALPVFQESLREKMTGLLAFLGNFGINISDLGITEAFDPGIAMKLVVGMLAGLKKVLANGFFILLTVIFILLEASSFPTKLRAILTEPEESLSHFNKFINSVQHYMAIKTVFSFITGIAVAVWLFVLDVPYPLLWGLLAFLLNYIPNIGSILASVPAILLALIQLGVGKAVIVLVGYLVINIIVGNVLEPKIMGRGLGLSTLVVFLSLVFWGWVFGPVGMLLSVPLTMTVKIALDSNEDTRWISTLLGSETVSP
jgi:predicted PurR-regulated permease PerM